MTQEQPGEQPEEHETMTGMLPVFNIPAYVLFDTGASHSFMSSSFRRQLRLECFSSGEELEVSIPSGNTINTSNIVRGIKLTLSGRKMEAYLYVLWMKEFDVILGMD